MNFVELEKEYLFKETYKAESYFKIKSSNEALNLYYEGRYVMMLNILADCGLLAEYEIDYKMKGGYNE